MLSRGGPARYPIFRAILPANAAGEGVSPPVDLSAITPSGSAFELVADSRTFISEDQPERLTARVRDFLTEHEPAAAR
jgi:hypothetical protein